MVCWLFCSSKCTYCSHCSVWKYAHVLKCMTLQFCLCLVYYNACKQQMWFFFIISYKRTEIICYFYSFYSFNCIMYFIRTNVPFWCESAIDNVLSIFVWFYHVHWKYLILYWLFLCCLLRLKVFPHDMPWLFPHHLLLLYHAQWCPPCMRLLPEFRKAAKRLGHTVNFGTVDCTIHTSLCSSVSLTIFYLIFWSASSFFLWVLFVGVFFGGSGGGEHNFSCHCLHQNLLVLGRKFWFHCKYFLFLY